MQEKICSHFNNDNFLITGDFRQHKETIEALEWVTSTTPDALQNFFLFNNYLQQESETGESIFIGSENIKLHFYHVALNDLFKKQFLTSCSASFLEFWLKKYPFSSTDYASEEAIFEEAGVAFIPSYLRENEDIITLAAKNELPDVIGTEDIAGIIHSHSKWSDGVNTPAEMAKAAIAKGLQYLVLSDHSKSAFYANGLQEERIRAQHIEIDELNKLLAPFKIFKSIESDILNDGSLDYSTEILSSGSLWIIIWNL